MTKEEKELLVKDLCARLPYGVKIELMPITKSKCTILTPIILRDYFVSDDANYLPYLRPISSMTEEERKEYKHLVAFSGSPNGAANFVDWLNKKMFAYRTIDGKDMFELGLTIVATKGMYKTTLDI